MAITFYIMKSAYNSYGADPICRIIANHLEITCLEFGPAIKEITIDILFQSKPDTSPEPSLEGLFQAFHANLERLPEYKFFRKKNRLSMQFLSHAAFANDIASYNSSNLDLKLYQVLFYEVIEHLRILKKRIKNADNFQTENFLKWLDTMLLMTPQTQEALLELEAQGEIYYQSKREQMNEWDILGIDWIDYHKHARKILDEPFYWSCSDEFGPHGNDAGADLLSFFQEWRKDNKKTSSEIFFTKLWQSWWGNDVPLDTVTDLKPNDFALADYDRLTVALAFAHLKFDASCPTWIQKKALASLKRQTEFARQEHSKWEHLEKYLSKADKMVKVLQNCQLKG